MKALAALTGAPARLLDWDGGRFGAVPSESLAVFGVSGISFSMLFLFFLGFFMCCFLDSCICLIFSRGGMYIFIILLLARI